MLASRPEFAEEIGVLRHSEEELDAIRHAQMQTGATLEAVAGF
jgi:hypothetical protein